MGTIAVWYMDGANLTGTATILTLPDDAYWKVVGTGGFNRDGYTDLVLQYDRPGNASDGDIQIWELNGVTRTSKIALGRLIDSSDPNWRTVATGDYSDPQDNYTDLVFQYGTRTGWGGTVKVQFMTGTSTNGSPVTVSTSPGTYNVAGPR